MGSLIAQWFDELRKLRNHNRLLFLDLQRTKDELEKFQKNMSMIMDDSIRVTVSIEWRGQRYNNVSLISAYAVRSHGLMMLDDAARRTATEAVYFVKKETGHS